MSGTGLAPAERARGSIAAAPQTSQRSAGGAQRLGQAPDLEEYGPLLDGVGEGAVRRRGSQQALSRLEQQVQPLGAGEGIGGIGPEDFDHGADVGFVGLVQ